MRTPPAGRAAAGAPPAGRAAAGAAGRVHPPAGRAAAGAAGRESRPRTTRRSALIATALATALLALTVACSSTPAPVEPPPTDTHPTAVFIGDSYTVGTGTSLDGSGFPAMLGGLRDWRVVNLAIPGTGYSTGQPDGRCPPAGCQSYIGIIPAAVEADPDVVVISGGRNDLSRRHLEPAVVAFYDELRAQLPDARLVVTSPLWDDTPTPEALETLRAQVEREATRVGADYLDLGDLFAGRADLIAPDGIHPDEEGLALIAQRIDELLG